MDGLEGVLVKFSNSIQQTHLNVKKYLRWVVHNSVVHSHIESSQMFFQFLCDDTLSSERSAGQFEEARSHHSRFGKFIEHVLFLL